MTTFFLVLGCVAIMFAAAMASGKPGRAVADTTLLVFLIGLIVICCMSDSKTPDQLAP